MTTVETREPTIAEQCIEHGFVNAKAVRLILKRAGLVDVVERVTASRSTTIVRLRWDKVREDKNTETATAVIEAIKAAFAEQGRTAKARVVWSGTIRIERRAQKTIRTTGEMARTTYRGRTHHIVVANAETGERTTACGQPLIGMAVWPVTPGIKVAACPTCEKCREAVSR